MSADIDRLLVAEAIRALIGSYLEAADRGRSAELAELFTPDGVLEIAGPSFDVGVHRGRGAILARLEANAAALRAAQDVPLLRHHVSSVRLGLDDPSSPTARSYFLAVTSAGPDHWGRYTDRFAETDAGWRFAHRLVTHEGRASGSWIDRRLTSSAANPASPT